MFFTLYHGIHRHVAPPFGDIFGGNFFLPHLLQADEARRLLVTFLQENPHHVGASHGAVTLVMFVSLELLGVHKLNK